MTAYPMDALRMSPDFAVDAPANRSRAVGDPQWLEVAARHQDARVTAGSMAFISLLAVVFAVLYTAIA